MSPVKGSKKRKMEKKPPAAKKSKLTSSPPETSLSTPVGKFASSLATFRTSSLSSPSNPLPAVCDSTKKKLSMFGASPSPGPAMLRPPRSGLPRQPMRGIYRLGGPRPLAPPLATGPRLSNVSTISPVSHHFLYTPQYSNQNIPPLVELDVSPPRSGYMHPSYPTRSDYLTPSSPHRSSSPPNSVVSKLSSLGVSVGREKVLATNLKHGWVLPPGISVTRTTPSREGPSLSLLRLANTLLQLGDGEGRKRLVQYNLSENQVKALDALGVKEDAMY